VFDAAPENESDYGIGIGGLRMVSILVYEVLCPCEPPWAANKRLTRTFFDSGCDAGRFMIPV
jgi:hypothetical protein